MTAQIACSQCESSNCGYTACENSYYYHCGYNYSMITPTHYVVLCHRYDTVHSRVHSRPTPFIQAEPFPQRENLAERGGASEMEVTRRGWTIGHDIVAT